jgi:hypothetical protein
VLDSGNLDSIWIARCLDDIDFGEQQGHLHGEERIDRPTPVLGYPGWGRPTCRS